MTGTATAWVLIQKRRSRQQASNSIGSQLRPSRKIARGRLQATPSPALLSKCIPRAQKRRKGAFPDTSKAQKTDKKDNFDPVCFQCLPELMRTVCGEKVQALRCCQTGGRRVSTGKYCTENRRGTKRSSQKMVHPAWHFYIRPVQSPEL